MLVVVFTSSKRDDDTLDSWQRVEPPEHPTHVEPVRLDGGHRRGAVDRLRRWLWRRRERGRAHRRP